MGNQLFSLDKVVINSTFLIKNSQLLAILLKEVTRGQVPMVGNLVVVKAEINLFVIKSIKQSIKNSSKKIVKNNKAIILILLFLKQKLYPIKGLRRKISVKMEKWILEELKLPKKQIMISLKKVLFKRPLQLPKVKQDQIKIHQFLSQHYHLETKMQNISFLLHF